MTYLALSLLVPVPLALGATGATLRRGPAHVLTLLAMAAVFAGAVLLHPGQTLAAGGAALGLTQMGRLELAFLAAVGVLLTCYHHLSGRTSSLPAVLPPLMAAIAAGCLFGTELLVAASFLQLAALLASLLMIGEQPDWRASLAGAMYLILSALGGMALLFGFVLANLQHISPGGLVGAPFVVAMLSVGFAVQWGVAPLHFWLPNVFQRAGPASAALAVCLLGPATLGLVLQALSALPQLVVDERVNRYLTYGGLFTATFGAVASLAPAKLGRTLGYALVADLGFVLVGVATYTRIGVAGAVLHFAHRSLAALLLLCAAAELERQDRGSSDGPPAAPYLWGTLLVGALALTGVPPLGGFAADWAIYQAVSLSDWRLAIALAGTSLICLAAILAALGRLQRPYPVPWRRPNAVEGWLMGLGTFVALWGLAAGPVVGAIHAAVAELPFLKPL